MSQNRTESMEKMHLRILHWGIILNILLPLVIFFLAVYFRDRLIRIRSVVEIDILFYALLIVSLGEIGAIFILRKRLWAIFSCRTGQESGAGNPVQEKPVGQSLSFAPDESRTKTRSLSEQRLFTFGLIIFSLCFSPTLYGLIYYLLGGTWEHFALFVAITFASFQFFKPRSDELDKLVRI